MAQAQLEREPGEPRRRVLPPLRRLGEGLAPSRLAPAPFVDAEASRLPLDRDDPGGGGFRTWPTRRRWSTRLRRARRGRRHATSASSLRSDLFRRRRRPPPDPVFQASILSPTHQPGGACRGRAERRHTATCSRGRHRFAGNRKARERRLSTARLKKVMGESFSSIGSIRFAGVFSQPRASEM